MSFVLPMDIVRYSCTCGSLNPISKIYFCRHCLQIRCGYCVCHEVDSNYCGNCLENLPSAEARLKKNRCAQCYDCPSCFYTLSIRATPVSTPSPDDPAKLVTTKSYYLACSFCRWTTRDAGFPDASAASGPWPERDNQNLPRINALMEYYKVVAMQERIERERKKFSITQRTRTFPTLTDRIGLTMAMARKRAGLPPIGETGTKSMSSATAIEPAVATAEVAGLPDDIFSKPVDLNSITSMPQRLAEPETQPSSVSELVPSHKHLFIKRSQRCRSCEHNVSKPEYNPASIKFKIQLSAYYHVPEVRIFTCEPLRLNTESHLIIKLCNPTQNMTNIEMLPLVDDKTQMSKYGDLISGTVVLPSCSVSLPQRDDAAEYDDSGDSHSFHDDPKVVVWRKGNKVMVKMPVSPVDSPSKEVVIGFLMKYSYTNTMTSLEQREKQTVDLHVPVYLKIGKILGNN